MSNIDTTSSKIQQLLNQLASAYNHYAGGKKVLLLDWEIAQDSPSYCIHASLADMATGQVVYNKYYVSNLMLSMSTNYLKLISDTTQNLIKQLKVQLANATTVGPMQPKGLYDKNYGLEQLAKVPNGPGNPLTYEMIEQGYQAAAKMMDNPPKDTYYYLPDNYVKNMQELNKKAAQQAVASTNASWDYTYEFTATSKDQKSKPTAPPVHNEPLSLDDLYSEELGLGPSRFKKKSKATAGVKQEAKKSNEVELLKGLKEQTLGILKPSAKWVLTNIGYNEKLDGPVTSNEDEK